MSIEPPDNKKNAIGNESSPLSLEHQLLLCDQISALVKSGMPLERGLKSVVAHLSKKVAQSAANVSAKLESGQSLSLAIANDPRPTSRSLSATVQAGLEGNCLSQALQSWISVHVEQARSHSRLRTAMVYPMVLVIAAACSIGFTIHHTIPLYQSMYESLHQPLPVWYESLLVIHRTLWLWVALFVIVALTAIFFYFRRQTKVLQNGMPLSLAYRLRLQSHASKLLAWLLSAERSSDIAEQLAIEATGFSTLMRESKDVVSWQPLSQEAQSILSAISQRKLAMGEACSALLDLAGIMQRQAERIADRQSRWFPVVASIGIGTFALATYVIVVYLPWVQLLTQLGG